LGDKKAHQSESVTFGKIKLNLKIEAASMIDQLPYSSLWDKYLDRHLEHLVVVHMFDFELISKLIGNVKGVTKITQQMCQQRWT
jgi:hypothetical protein